jgi:hypothetical protein
LTTFFLVTDPNSTSIVSQILNVLKGGGPSARPPVFFSSSSRQTSVFVTQRGGPWTPAPPPSVRHCSVYRLITYLAVRTLVSQCRKICRFFQLPFFLLPLSPIFIFLMPFLPLALFPLPFLPIPFFLFPFSYNPGPKDINIYITWAFNRLMVHRRLLHAVA